MTGFLRDEDLITVLKIQITLNVNQKQLAKEIGISPAYLSDLLNGKRGFSDKILKYLKVEKVYRRLY
jgi:transcriptional regulator with XRE-family HTH domain